MRIEEVHDEFALLARERPGSAHLDAPKAVRVAVAHGDATFLVHFDRGFLHVGEQVDHLVYDPLGEQRKMLDFVEDFSEEDLHKLPDVGNKPSYAYILRRHHWEGGEK